jgi:hypothetical protein
MSMPFAMRMGKGVRISASSRGLRAHVGPRRSRIHFGSGRTNVSTGKGPFTYYTGLGGSSRSTSSGPSQRQLALAQKEQEFLRLREVFEAILEIHRVEFPRAKRPVAPPAEAVDEASLRKAREKEELVDVPVWKRGDRKTAKTRARELAAEDVRIEKERREQARIDVQRELDEVWERLCSNDPATVIDVIDDAFEDNEAPAAPVDVQDATLSLVMLAPPEDEVPEKKPALTPSGNPTVKKLTKSEAADTYLTLICGHLLATIKEALAVAPKIAEVKAVVVRRTDEDVYGQRHLEALLAAQYAREDLNRVKWKDAFAPDVVQQTARELHWQLKGRPPRLEPLDLDEEPELKMFLDALEERAPEGEEDS